MKILGINTATNRTAVALIDIPGKSSPELRKQFAKKKTNVLFTKSWDSNRDEAEKVMPAIAAALKKGRPDLIFVVRGPGAFTGLRIGVTIANTLAFILKVPITAVSTHDYLRERMPAAKRGKTAQLLRAGGEFAAVLLPGNKKPQRIAKSALAEFFQKKKGIKFLIGDMGKEERKLYPVPEKVIWIPENRLAEFPDVMTVFAQKKIRKQKTVRPVYMLPPRITKSKKPVFITTPGVGQRRAPGPQMRWPAGGREKII